MQTNKHPVCCASKNDPLSKNLFSPLRIFGVQPVIILPRTHASAQCSANIQHNSISTKNNEYSFKIS